MKVAIVGSRGITDREVVESAVAQALNHYKLSLQDIVVLSGGAKGVDTIAKDIAKDHNRDFVLFKPYHMLDSAMEYSPRFFFTRNKQIADNSDIVIIVWDGQSNGTKHMIDYCTKKLKPFFVYRTDK